MIVTMDSLDSIMGSVDRHFTERRHGRTGWPDPHLDRPPAEDEYSRLTNPGRWRIVVDRGDAWLTALKASGGCQTTNVAPDTIVWAQPSGPTITSAVRVDPYAEGALSMVVARTRLGDLPDVGVVVGVASPTVVVAVVPDCGCDACDSGSDNELNWLDDLFAAVITGHYRRLDRGPVTITTGIGTPGTWSMTSTSGQSIDRTEVDDILADPEGWNELSGSAWF